jgi:uncharacterized alkaline shock family protein YloU
MDDGKIEFGSIQIHKKVLADIAASVIKDIDGVTIAPKDPWTKVRESFGRKNYNGIEVTIDKDNQVSIAAKVCVRYGIYIPDIARQVQDSVRRAIERTTDISLRDVNINIQSIERGQE